MTRDRNTKEKSKTPYLTEQKKRTLIKLAKVVNSDSNGVQKNYLLGLIEHMPIFEQ